ncbi:MAG: outer membrane protein assembly factor BamD [Deltaproteobacteria bacterium]|nr:outer membrane protein assembly factor BamD [Deltaproteobacteria bacterium]
MRLTRIFISIILVLTVTGCGLFGRDGSMQRATPGGLFQQGYEDYQDGKYKKAIESFQRLKEEYPLSQYAILAEIGIADSFFSKGDYMEAEVAYGDFMDFHPTNENLPYVMYQLGMSHYKQVLSIDRDQTEVRKARDAFERLITRFPSTKFAFIAEQRLRDCQKRLAEHEFYVGKFYFDQGEYQAALRRFQLLESDYAGLGLDYKVSYFLHETKKRLAEQGKGS